MATVSGVAVTCYQGETLDIEFSVVNGSGAAYSLAGGEAVLTYKSMGGTATDVICVISTSTVTASFAHATTQLMAGLYNFQLMCRNASNQIVMTKEGTIEVKTSLNPDAAIP